MDCNLDWKNIAGLFPISQQMLGIYEIGKGLYEIIATICESVSSSFKELRETNSSEEEDLWGLKNHRFVPVNFTPEMKRNGMSYEPNFRDLDEDSDEENSKLVGARGNNPELTRLVGSGEAIHRNNCVIFHCDPNAPLMSREEKNAAIDCEEPFIGIFDSSEVYEYIPSTWEKLQEPISIVGVGILYFIPVVGTIYSGMQLAKVCLKHS